MAYNKRKRGHYIKAGRHLAGLTQTELAEKLHSATGDHWTRNMVTRLEGNLKVFDVVTLAALCEITGLELAFFVDGPAQSS